VIAISYAAITDELWVGSYPQQPEDVLHLKSIGVTAILNLQSDADFSYRGIQWDMFWKFYVSQGLTVVRVPIIDFDLGSLSKNLADGVAALEALVAGDHRVYLHCTAGLNRSPTVAIAWLMKHRGMSLREAHDHVEEQRSVQPYPEVLHRWKKSLT